MSGSCLTNIAGERGIRKLERCSDQKAGNMPDWQEQPGHMPRTQMPLHSIQMLPIWSAQPVALAQIRMSSGPRHH